MMAVPNLKVARVGCSSLMRNPDKAEIKVGDMVLLKNHVPTNAFHAKYKSSFRICKCISDKAFDVQDSAGKVRCLSIHHLQLLHLAEHVLIQLPDMASFGRTLKYINHPKLISNLHTPTNAQNKQDN